jgi:hypothetical protein
MRTAAADRTSWLTVPIGTAGPVSQIGGMAAGACAEAAVGRWGAIDRNRRARPDLVFGSSLTGP